MSDHSTYNYNLLPIFAFFGIVAGVRAFIGSRNPCQVTNKSREKSETSLVPREREYVPPLPLEVVTILNASRLCFLATQHEGEPHISLMNFTYYQQEECILLSTRRNTKKYAQITSSPKVAILIHDFPHLNGASDQSHGKSWSITLNCQAEVIEDNDLSEKYRSAHLKNNPEYGQFIVGAEQAMVLVHIETARMCDFNDRVSYWTAKEGNEAKAF